ncbi:hypothetical protein ACTG16_23660 [Aeromonas sp. 23P]|uniref:hypothetical protein n=1 Tax=Aeromonas sp. 23P TaxID=3452716 RepID=UPI003F78E85A|nr:hypothetical protein [Aeromonas veronii]
MTERYSVRESIVKQAHEAARADALLIGKDKNMELNNLLVIEGDDIYPLCGGESIANPNLDSLRRVEEAELDSLHSNNAKRIRLGINGPEQRIDGFDDGFRRNGVTFVPMIGMEQVRKLLAQGELCSDFAVAETGEITFEFDGDRYEIPPVSVSPEGTPLYECNFPGITPLDLSKGMDRNKEQNKGVDQGLGM